MKEAMQSPWFYLVGLSVISLLLVLIERAYKIRKDQPMFRRRWSSDLIHLGFNAHFLGVILYGIAANRVLPYVDRWLSSMGWTAWVYRDVATSWSVGGQIVVALLVIDFSQWCVHNLLHRVSWLWEFHKTHHSVVDGEMDWMVAFRFQWAEVVVYRLVLFFPLAWFGFGLEAIMFHAIFGTLIGHLNHANLSWDYGPFRYLLNNPRMHIWHHDYYGDRRSTVNYGIIFSIWDWVFGTAKLPDGPPQKLGFPGVESFPTHFLGQTAWPWGCWFSNRWGTVVEAGVGLVIIACGYLLAQPW